MAGPAGTTAGVSEIGEKAELRFGTSTVAAVGHTTVTPVMTRMFAASPETVEVELDFSVENVGAVTAQNVYVQVEYEATKGVWKPADLANGANEWNISQPQPLVRMFASHTSGLSQGKIYLYATQEGSDKGNDIAPAHQRTVQAKVLLPKSYYNNEVYQDDSGTAVNSLNLRFTIGSDATEANATNNVAYRDVVAVSLFKNVPAHAYLPQGKPSQLTIPIDTTLIANPVVTVREMVTREEDKLLTTLEYNALTNRLTIIPKVAANGTGMIRLADVGTGSFKDFTFTVGGGSGINITPEDSRFTFSTTNWNESVFSTGDKRPYKIGRAHV